MNPVCIDIAERDLMPRPLQILLAAWASQPGLADLAIVEVHVHFKNVHRGDLLVNTREPDGRFIVDGNELVREMVRVTWNVPFPTEVLDWITNRLLEETP